MGPIWYTLSVKHLHLSWLVLALCSMGCSGTLLLDFSAPQCQTHEDCDPESACLGGACVTSSAVCSLNAPEGLCSDGRICCDGVCAQVLTCDEFCACEPTETCSAGVCVLVTDDSSCSPLNPGGLCVGSESCVAGQCLLCIPSNACGPERPRGCCPSDTLCAGGTCVPRDEVADLLCSAANPAGLCVPGERCEGGTCILAPCSADDPTGFCPTLGEACNGVECEPFPCSPTRLQGMCLEGQYCSAVGACLEDGLCGVTADCAAGMRCSAVGQCILTSTCLVDADCPEFHACDATTMTCQRDLACVNGDDCMPGEFCGVGGECLVEGACTMSPDCNVDEFCSVIGMCLAAGTCAVDGDCLSPEYCSVTGQCLAPGDCGADGDCLPGRTCSPPTCAVDPADACTVNAPLRFPCPPGETCCPEGTRCSAMDSNSERACIPNGQCIDDSDCLNEGGTAYYTCDPNNLCVPVTSCDGSGDCEPGERCNLAGACIPQDKCALSVDCALGEVCNGLFECESSTMCGFQDVETDLIEPNMLVLLDRSGSMARLVGPTCDNGTNNRWNITRDALFSVVAATEQSIRYGLSTYPAYCPGSPVCGVDNCDSSASPSCVDLCNWPEVCGAIDGTNPETACNALAGCEWTGAACATRGVSLDSQWSTTCGLVTAAYDPQAVCDALPPCSWGGTQCDPAFETVCGMTAGGVFSCVNQFPGDVDVSVRSEAGSAFLAALSAPTTVGTQHPGGFTPTDRSLRYIAAQRDRFLPTDALPRDNFVLLMTDGNTTYGGGTFGVCDGDRSTYDPGNVYGTFTDTNALTVQEPSRVNCAVDELMKSDPPVTTFVVGFVGGKANWLNCHALWGGTSRCGTSGAAGVPTSILAPACPTLGTEAACEGGCVWDGANCGGSVGCDSYSEQSTCDSAGVPGCVWTGSACGGGIDGESCNTDTLECFFRADDSDKLIEAFEAITEAAASCSFRLDRMIDVPQDLFVFAEYLADPPGEVQLTRTVGHLDGWWALDAAEQRVEIFGTACEAIQSGQASVRAVFACGGGG